MASEVRKKMIKIHFEASFTVSLQIRFGVGGVISSAAISFPSHRSLFTVMYFIALFEYQASFPSSMPTGSERFECGNESVTHSAQSKFSWQNGICFWKFLYRISE